MEKYKTIKENSRGQIVEKKSKFIANLFYIENVEEAEELIRKTKKKYHDARHNCFAYITLEVETGELIEKCSDDGEPSGTAGAPMLALLKGNNLCNVLVIVTRYFGGILLGTGGLVRAYQEATKEAIKNATFMYLENGVQARCIVPYADVESFKFYAKKNHINIVKEEYLENAEFLIEISNEMLEKLETDIDKFPIKMTRFDVLNKKTIKTTITA